ncbi:MAG TPA: hypothetical protein VMT43_03195, partial [Acidimicrobiales bacterium]|nr:hypothetical protein [Acidimicrobiales bacterium]
FEMLRVAAATEPDVMPVHREMEAHRAHNLRVAVEWIAARGPLRLDLDRAAETMWALASPDLARLLCDVGGWTTEAYADWLDDVLVRVLLAEWTTGSPTQ